MTDGPDVSAARRLLRRGAQQARRASRSLAAAADEMDKAAATDHPSTLTSDTPTKAAPERVAKEKPING